MIRYRIYTEDMGDVKGILSGIFNDATVIKARGMWHGSWENSIVIEGIATDTEIILVRDACKRIKLENNQDAVIFTEEPIVMEVV